MIENLQLVCIGIAAVVDTALLLALVERANWRAVTIWMLLLCVGLWMWHAGMFVYLLLNTSVSELALAIRWGAMAVMTTGLLMMPSAMLHGLYRLHRTGVSMGPHPLPGLAVLYLPLTLLWPIGQRLLNDPSGTFLELVAPYKLLYLVWMSISNVVFAVGLLNLRATLKPQHRFLEWMAASYFAVTPVNIFLIVYGIPTWPEAEVALYTIVTLTPLVPVLVFTYCLMRFQMLPFVLERTFVYGTMIAGLMLLHRVATRDLSAAMQSEFRVDFGVVEGIGLTALILVYQPLRSRVAEALRYLFGTTAEGRAERRRLAVEMASRGGQPASDIADWFAGVIAPAFGAGSATFWLLQDDGGIVHRAGDRTLLEEHRVAEVHQALQISRQQACTRYDAPTPEVLECLHRSRASALARLKYQDVNGLLVLGARHWNQPLTEEELSALLLLVEQLGATLHNTLLQELRLLTERRMLQQEKLSTLGLLASTLAHEVKNPLSSIKTIATVLAEDLGPASPHSADLGMILGEINRLTSTTSQLLQMARPVQPGAGSTSLTEALRPVVQILNHLARQRNVELRMDSEAEATGGSPTVAAADSSVREICFNLLCNAIEAAGPAGKVRIGCRCVAASAEIEIHNTGPAIPAEHHAQLFEPFFTTKEQGTGLGLYVVRRRVLELGGDISCESSDDSGTRFIVRLPLAPTKVAVSSLSDISDGSS